MTRWLLTAMVAASLGCGCAVNEMDQSMAGEEGPTMHEETEGEEQGPALAKDATHDTVRRGVRMILNYDAPADAFVGTVQNVTDEPVAAVRVEVHLSNGTELGPTPRETLEPGQTRPVSLSAEGQDFTTWKAHAESGEGTEHGHGLEGEGEHGREGEGEHGREGEGEHGESGEHR